MKTTSLKNHTKKVLFVFALLFIIISFSSCGKKVKFLNSSVVPAAQGYVKIKQDKNKNNVIDIELTNLAGPERLQPPKNVYVVWMETANNAKNLGKINSSSSFLSKKLKGSFKTISSFKPSRIFITAEDEANIQYPVGPVALTTDSF